MIEKVEKNQYQWEQEVNQTTWGMVVKGEG